MLANSRRPSVIRDVVRYASGRQARTYLYAAGLTATACIAVWPLFPDSNLAIIPIAFLSGRHIRWTPLWELAPSVLAAAAPVLWAPRMPHVEHQGWRRLETYAVTAALLTIVTTAGIPFLAGISLPPGARLGVIASNVTLIAGLSLILASTLGLAAGPLLAITAYVGLIVVQHSSPELAVSLPFGGIPENPGPHWITSGLMAAVGATLWTYSLGSRLSARD